MARVALALALCTAAGRADDEPGEGPPVAPEAPDEAPPAQPPPVIRFTNRVLTDSASYVTGEAYPYDVESVPQVRPRPLFELGDPFQGQGFLNDGIELPGGAVWNPSLLVFGTFRTAVQAFDDGVRRPNGFDYRSEWANRLDLFVNLRLSATERILFGIRPMDDPTRGDNLNRSQFTGWEFEPREKGVERFNGRVRTLFFEGDLGEMFPILDPSDDSPLDLGFSIGRQPLLFQDGVLINGTMDAVGITHNNFHLPGSSKMRLTAIYAMPDMIQTTQANRFDVVAFQSEIDTSWSTIELDGAYRNSRGGSGSGLFFGVGVIQRIWKLNSVFRYNLSTPLGRGPGEIGNGHLFISELSLDLPWPHALAPLVYMNAFLGIDHYQSAFRDSGAGGPLGRVGILFASPGIGRYGSPLNAFPDRSWGGALGCQMFLGELKQTQFVVEVGTRSSLQESVADSAVGVSARVQQGLFGQALITVEGFFAKQERLHEAAGGRLELLIQF